MFLYDQTLFPGFDLVACIFHKLREPPGQFVNALRLPSFTLPAAKRYEKGSVRWTAAERIDLISKDG